ncbi:cytochrome c biogenesis protein DipZ [soil metagenome]
MLLLLAFAFVAGVVTILSPCILPVLPIVLSGSVGDGKKRPLGIVAGFVISFTFFTLALTAIVKATGISSDSLRIVAVFVIAFFGITLLLPQTQVLLEKITSKLSGIAPNTADKSGFTGGFLVGLSLGLIWTPCVGPILAAVITLAVTQTVNAQSFLITLAYSMGSAVPMLAITTGSQRILKNVSFFQRYSVQIQRVFGVIMILTALGIYFNLDRQFQTYVLTAFPQYGSGLTSIENNKAVQDQLSKLRTTNTNGTTGASSTVDSSQLLSPATVKAPDFVGGQQWINSQPLSLQKELKGKVVLVDFWTYSCINCIRTLPYLKQWYADYKDKGLVIVGVHSPEFAFEHVYSNVQKATKDFGLEYPIVQDNDFKIWSAYSNQAWPAHYLIDKDGYIRYSHLGEGNYVETENAIRLLLDEQPLNKAETPLKMRKMTPETYLGTERFGFSVNGPYTSQTKISRGKAQEYTDTNALQEDELGLVGNWTVNENSILANTDGANVRINFLAQQVYLVMDNPNSVTGQVQVMLDGKPLPAKYQTAETDSAGKVTVKDARKYDLIDLKEDYGRHELELVFPAGLQGYAFTFGS